MRSYRALLIAFLCVSSVMFGQSSDANALSVECRALMVKGEALQAVQKAQSAVQANPSQAMPHGLLAEMLAASLPKVRLDMYPKFKSGARSEAMKALAMDPFQPNALESLRILEGRAHGVAQLVPLDVMLRIDRAEAQLRSGQVDQASAAFAQIAQIEPRIAGIYCYAGDAWVADGKMSLAVQAYQQALAQDHENLPALCGLATAEMKSEHLDKAVSIIGQAIEIDPSSTRAWDVYEVIERQSGRALTQLTLPLWVIEKYPGKGKLEWLAEMSDERPDSQFWEKYRISYSVELEDLERGIKPIARWASVATSPYGACIVSWVDAIKSLPPKDDPGWDPVVTYMRKFDKDDHLQPAVFLLFYEPRWASEYRAWRKSNPNGVMKFLETYAVRPGVR